jgi:hypothetical protein
MLILKGLNSNRKLNRNLYGGLAQQEPYDPNGIMSRLKHLADMDPGVCYPGQYHNDHVSLDDITSKEHGFNKYRIGKHMSSGLERRYGNSSRR